MTMDVGRISSGFQARVVVKKTFIEVLDDVDEDMENERVVGFARLARRVRSDSALFDLARGEATQPSEASLAPGHTAAYENEDAEPRCGSGDEKATEDGPTRFNSFDSSMEDSAGSGTSAPPSPSLDFVPQDPAQVPALGDVGLLMSENARLSMENQLLWEQARLMGQLQEAQGTMLPLAAGRAPSAAGRPSQHPSMDAPGRAAAAAPRGKARKGPDDQQKQGEVPIGERTTLMLRNVPNNYTRAMLLAMLDEEGFKGCYDFLYLPIDFNSGACLGYAFVNLADPGCVDNFWKTFDGYSKWILPSRKVCRVSWSGPHQGLEAHIARYRNSPVMHESVCDSYKPVLFSEGYRVAFPGPSKNPRAPRVRHRGDGGAGRRQKAGR